MAWQFLQKETPSLLLRSAGAHPRPDRTIPGRPWEEPSRFTIPAGQQARISHLSQTRDRDILPGRGWRRQNSPRSPKTITAALLYGRSPKKELPTNRSLW